MRRLPTPEEVHKVENPPLATAGDTCGQVLVVPSEGLKRDCVYGRHVGPHSYDYDAHGLAPPVEP